MGEHSWEGEGATRVCPPGRSALWPHTTAASRRLHSGQWAGLGDPGGSTFAHVWTTGHHTPRITTSALAGSAVTNDLRLGGLNMYFSQFWKLGSLRPMCWQFLFLLVSGLPPLMCSRAGKQRKFSLLLRTLISSEGIYPHDLVTLWLPS